MLDDLLNGKDRIELMLSLGASRWEAAHPLIQRAMTQGLLPLLNMLSLVRRHMYGRRRDFMH